MPEGPSLVILGEEVARFRRKRILAATGNAKFDKTRLVGRCPTFRTWGKHFLIEVPGFAVRVHFLMFGSYTIDTRKDREPRLQLTFRNGELNFYSCAIKPLEAAVDEIYDWRTDVMSEAWDPAIARRKLRAMPDTLVCDALLDQNVFAGVGNIIKNEVLFRIRVHPLSTVGALPVAKLRELVREARNYSFDFLKWKKQFVLRKHWLAHNKSQCASCGGKLTRDYLGVTDRRSFFCERCQTKYVAAPARSSRARGKAKAKR